jgi:hypothetical protein
MFQNAGATLTSGNGLKKKLEDTLEEFELNVIRKIFGIVKDKVIYIEYLTLLG